MTQSSDNSLQLWQIDGSTIALKHSVTLEGRLKTISCLCLERSKKRLLVGTEGGNITPPASPPPPPSYKLSRRRAQVMVFKMWTVLCALIAVSSSTLMAKSSKLKRW